MCLKMLYECSRYGHRNGVKLELYLKDWKQVAEQVLKV